MNGYHSEDNRKFPSEFQFQQNNNKKLNNTIDYFSGDFVEDIIPKQEYRSGRSSVPAHLLSRTENNFFDKKPIPPKRNHFFDFNSSTISTLPWRKNQNPNHQQPPDVREQFRSIADQSNRLIDDLLAPYSLTLPVQTRQNYSNLNNLETNFHRRPNSVVAEPVSHQNQRRIDPLRQQNKEKIQSSTIHYRNPFIAQPESEVNPRPTHRTFSEPNGYQPSHTLDILSTSLYDPNSPYYSNRPSIESEVTQKPYFSDTDEFFDDEDMNRTTPNWRNNFSQVRERFGTKAQNSDDGSLPYAHDFSFASDGSLTMPRNRGLLKSTSQTVVGTGRLETSRSSSMLQNALSRRAETPEVIFRRNSETPENTFRQSSETPENPRKGLGNFWLETVRNRASSPSIQVQRPAFKMTAAQERLEQLHEPVDGPANDGFQTLNSNFNHGNGNGKINGNGNFRRIGSESVAQRKMQFIAEDKNGTISKPFLSERFISERKSVNGNNSSSGNNGNSYSFKSLDHAVEDLKQNTEKLFDSKGCGKFPIGEFTANLPVKRIGIFTGTRISPPRNFSTQIQQNLQHSPSPDSLSGESTASLANLPHPRPKHNIREQLMNAGVGNNTYLGPYMGRRPGTPNFPAPSSGSVASRISVFEKRPGTPTLLQLAVGSSLPQTPEPPRSPLSPRTTVFRTKSVIHVDMGPESEKRIGAISPEYDNRRIETVSTSAAFTFKDQHDPNFSPRWRSDTVNEAQPMLKAIQQKESAESQITLTPIKKSLESLTNAKFHFELEQPPTKSPYSSSNREIIAKPLHKTHEVKNLQNGLPPMMPNHSKIAGKLANTERFYYPTGKPVSKAENDAVLQRVQQLFNVQPNMPASGFDEIATRIGLPLYSKKAIFEACCQCSHHPVNLTPTVNFQDFVVYWNKMTSQSHDESSRFIFTLSVAKSGLPGKNYLQREDFHSIFFDLIFTYPGLKFLIDASQFHARYVEVVIARIFWNVNRSWTGKITTFELKKSNFLQTMKLLEKTDEINKITDYFSYEHFYVIYCKFWELDTDHDMIISRDDMRRHGDGALTDRIIDRIFSPAVTRVPRKNYPGIGPIKSGPLETIGFEEFVAFLLAEEDKRHPTAIEYWFRCLDLDGDGVISMYEMELFYKDIATKINQKGYETLSFKDVASQLYDLVSPVDKQIRLSDLKRCGLAYRFFNTFVNYIKYLEQESSDGERASVKMNGDKEMSDWEQFCAVEYEILMTEAGDEGNDESYDLVVDDDGELEDGTYQEN